MERMLPIFNFEGESLIEVISKAFIQDHFAEERVRLLIKAYLSRKVNLAKFRMRDPHDIKIVDELISDLLR